MNSAELIVLRREVVGQVRQEVEVRRAVAVVRGGWRSGGVHRFGVKVAVVVGVGVAFRLGGASWWRDDGGSGCRDRGRRGGHPRRRERIRRGDVAVGNAGRLAALVDVQLTGLLVVVGVRVTLGACSIVTGTGMHRRLMGHVALRRVLLLMLLLLLDVVVVVLTSLNGNSGVAVRRQILVGGVIVAAARVAIVARRCHVVLGCLVVLSGVSLAGVVGAAALHGSMVGRVIGWTCLRIAVVLPSGVGVLVLLLVELHARVVHRPGGSACCRTNVVAYSGS